MTDSLDGVSLGFALAYVTIFIALKATSIVSITHLGKVRNNAIEQVLKKENECSDFEEFLEKVGNNSKVLLYKPQHGNKLLTISFIIFCIFSVIAVGYTPLINHFPIKLSLDWVFSFFITSLFFSAYLLYYDIKYYREYKMLELDFPLKEPYPINSHEKVKVCSIDYLYKKGIK